MRMKNILNIQLKVRKRIERKHYCGIIYIYELENGKKIDILILMLGPLIKEK